MYLFKDGKINQSSQFLLRAWMMWYKGLQTPATEPDLVFGEIPPLVTGICCHVVVLLNLQGDLVPGTLQALTCLPGHPAAQTSGMRGDRHNCLECPWNQIAQILSGATVEQ